MRLALPLFQIAGALLAASAVTVHAQPVNDLFADRITLAGPAVTAAGSNVGATTEPGEPITVGFSQRGATVWWTWTAPATGQVYINTFGSSFDTVLAIFTGAGIGQLTQVALNDNAPGQVGVSQVIFNAQLGVQYQIQVAGTRPFGFPQPPPQTGTIQLQIAMPPSVAISSPASSSIFSTATNFFITATANAAAGAVAKVDFYSGTRRLGTAMESPYTVAVSNAPLGSNSLYAVVLDTTSQVATSAVVSVLVVQPGLTIISPPDGVTLPFNSPVNYAIYALLPSGTMTNVEFFANGIKVGEDRFGPLRVFNVIWYPPVGGSYRLTVTGKSNLGQGYRANSISFGVETPLVVRGSVWKYLDNGSDQGTAWIAPGFDDGSWAAGRAELGYGDGDEATIVGYGPDPGNRYITTYFRRAFTVTNAAGYTNLTLNVKRDDGAVVYLNGSEAARFNMPGGPINYVTLAPNAQDDGTNFHSAILPAGLLVEGVNVLAVEIHQSGPTSNDISFDLELIGLPMIMGNHPPAIALTSPAQGQVFQSPASFTLAAEVSDLDGLVAQVAFFRGDTELARSVGGPYALPLQNLPAGIHTFTAIATDNEGASTVSAPLTVLVYESATRWTAYNDHYAGPNTHPFATAWNAFGTEGGAPGNEGPLRNIATGAPVPATLTIVELGAMGDTDSGAPPPGTPAYETFNETIDFGSGNLNHAILVDDQALVLHLFTGLNPDRRYRLRATAVGGVPAHSNRWTQVTIVGAPAFAAAHTANVLTSNQEPDWLYPDEAAMNTGDNLSGDMVGWDNILAGPDGAFLVVSTQYLGPAPGNRVPGPFAFAPVAIQLQEIGPWPLVEITEPKDGLTIQGPTNITVTAIASAVDGITHVLFLGNNNAIGQAAAGPYGVVWQDPPFGTNHLLAVAFDSAGFPSTSAPVSVIITIPPTNTVPPAIYAQNPPAGATITQLTGIEVTFTEPVVGVDAADLLVNQVPAIQVAHTGHTNYLFTIIQPPYGPVQVQWAANHGISDVGWPVRLPFAENQPGASWSYLLIDRTPPVILAQNPPANTTVTNLIQLEVTFSEPVVGVNARDLLVNGFPAYAVSGSGGRYTFDFSQPPSGAVNISWDSAHGIADQANPPNHFNANGPGATWSYTLDARTTLVQSNSYWAFRPGLSEASDPVDAWRQLQFDDSTWISSPAPFFFGDPYSNGVPAYTHLTDMQGDYTSIFLRQTFVLRTLRGITNLILRAQSDDGFIAWINGVEVTRYNMAPGQVPFNGTANASAPEPAQRGAAYIDHTLPNPSSYLLPGLNVLAVHAFNQLSSSDFGFDAQLYTYQISTELLAPRIVGKTPAPGHLLALTQITVTFSEPVANVDASDLLINGIPATGLSGSTNTSYTFSFNQPPYGPVAVTWSANHGIVDLDVKRKPFDALAADSTWAYTLLNPNTPYLLSVVPAQRSTINQLTQLTVVFSEPVTGVDAADLLVNNTPAVNVSGSGTDYTFFFPEPPYGIVTLSWEANHGIRDLDEPALAFDPSWPNHTWTYTLIDQTPPAVASQDPFAESHVLNLTQITVAFTEPVTGVSAGDLLINGLPATSFTGSDVIYTFFFPQPNASSIQVTWADDHDIRDRAPVPNAFEAAAPGSRWTYSTLDNVPPRAAVITPPPFLAVRSLQQIKVSFDEPVAGVSAGDLLMNGLPAQQVTGAGIGPYTFAFSQPPTGQVQMTWAPGHGIQDLAPSPNPFGGGPWTYLLDPNLATEFALRHVIHLSVDGLGGTYLRDYVNNWPAQFPNHRRFVTEGAASMNARVDYTASETVPNHSSQLTGRPVEQPAGWANTTHHGVTFNSDNGQTIHTAGNPAVPYKFSSFDVVHDNGLSTAFLYSKQSLTFLARSWSTGGGPDLIGEDNGSNKIDRIFSSVNAGNYGPSSALVDEVVLRIQTNGLWNYTFMHWTEPDQYGHQLGWGSATYSNEVLKLDFQLGRILDALKANPVLGNLSALILTSDHGGGTPLTTHFDETAPLNYTIPFCIWGGGIPAGVDAHSLFRNRADPGNTRPSYSDTSVTQPLRNGDAGNVAVTLLGLPPIPGSSLIPVFGSAQVPLLIARSGLDILISWPANADGYELQATGALGPDADWQTVRSGIATNAYDRVFLVRPAPDAPPRFFRLHRR